MMNFVNKFVLFLMAVVLLFGIFSINVTALAATSQEQLEEAVNNLNDGKNRPEDDPYRILSDVMSIMGWTGFAIAIFKMMQIGINFMLGAGNRRANAKDSIFPWALGCLICALFGILGPWFIEMVSYGNGDVFGSLFFLF